MNLSNKQREEIRQMFGGKCAYCGCDLSGGWCTDHVKPVGRKMRYTTNPKTGYGMLVKTKEVDWPERDTIDNLFPCCRACNIHKGSFSLEGWRKELGDLVGVLRRGYPTYRHAVRFEQVFESPSPIVFWFEKWKEFKNANPSN